MRNGSHVSEGAFVRAFHDSLGLIDAWGNGEEPVENGHQEWNRNDHYNEKPDDAADGAWGLRKELADHGPWNQGAGPDHATSAPSLERKQANDKSSEFLH